MEVLLVPHETKRDVVCVFVQGELWKEVHAAIFGKKPDFSFLKEIGAANQQFALIEQALAKRFALQRLTKRQMSSFHMRELLQEKLVSEDTISSLIAYFEEMGWINDREWMESFIRFQERKKWGPKAIAHKLRLQGAPRWMIEHAEEGQSSQQERIAALLSGRYQNRNLQEPKEKQKVVRSLLQKGFDLEEILSCFNLLEREPTK